MNGRERRAYALNVDQVKQPTLALYLVLGKKKLTTSCKKKLLLPYLQIIFSTRIFETVTIKDDTPGSATVKTSYMNNVNSQRVLILNQCSSFLLIN